MSVCTARDDVKIILKNVVFTVKISTSTFEQTSLTYYVALLSIEHRCHVDFYHVGMYRDSSRAEHADLQTHS